MVPDITIGADSLSYIDLDELVSATTITADRLCMACFDGVYPVELPEEALLGKHSLEAVTDRTAMDEVVRRP